LLEAFDGRIRTAAKLQVIHEEHYKQQNGPSGGDSLVAGANMLSLPTDGCPTLRVLFLRRVGRDDRCSADFRGCANLWGIKTPVDEDRGEQRWLLLLAPF
jgi:hypothetical protein